MKGISRRAALWIAAAMLMAGGAGVAQAAALVQISLWDKGVDTPMPIGLAYATPGLDIAKATMGIKTSPGAVKAGEVTSR
jgi:uncharacterized cupredoxin-like copper-binding protein